MPTWNEFIAGWRIWKRGTEVAVHKPLLLLFILRQARTGGSNRFHFKDLVDDLEKGLRDFGPSRKSIHPEYGFWHLQDDDFWVIEDKDKIQVPRGGSEPTKSTLLEDDAVGFVPQPAWQALTRDPALIRNLVAALLNTYWPDHGLQRQIRKQVGL
jgi:putative restriction endonuclease